MHQSKKIKEVKAVVSKKFSLKEGPFILGLESALQELDVHRQAYHGAVHKLLKVTHVYKMYNTSPAVNVIINAKFCASKPFCYTTCTCTSV